MPKYYYIISNEARLDDTVSQFRLYDGKVTGKLSVVLRVPAKGLNATYFRGRYWRTFDRRTLRELGCIIMVRIDGRFRERNINLFELPGYPVLGDSHRVHELMHADGFDYIPPGATGKPGYFTKREGGHVCDTF